MYPNHCHRHTVIINKGPVVLISVDIYLHIICSVNFLSNTHLLNHVKVTCHCVDTSRISAREMPPEWKWPEFRSCITLNEGINGFVEMWNDMSPPSCVLLNSPVMYFVPGFEITIDHPHTDVVKCSQLVRGRGFLLCSMSPLLLSVPPQLWVGRGGWKSCWFHIYMTIQPVFVWGHCPSTWRNAWKTPTEPSPWLKCVRLKCFGLDFAVSCCISKTSASF